MMRHNKQFFYKYVTAKTALLILQNKKLKYSSPLTFNDPFDVQTKIDYDFDLGDLISSLSADVQHKTKGFMDEYKKQHEKLNDWWQLEVKNSRVFCVAEDNDNLLMWAHYAKDHSGAVIQFECLPAIDNTLCAAMQVTYVNRPPVIATLDEYMKKYRGEHELDFKSLYYEMFTSKSSHWAYEKEWRVFIASVENIPPALAHSVHEYDSMSILMNLHPEEIHSIYLGCKIDDDIHEEIESSLNGDLSHVQLYRSLKEEREYKLNFKQIK